MKCRGVNHRATRASPALALAFVREGAICDAAVAHRVQEKSRPGRSRVQSQLAVVSLSSASQKQHVVGRVRARAQEDGRTGGREDGRGSSREPITASWRGRGEARQGVQKQGAKVSCTRANERRIKRRKSTDERTRGSAGRERQDERRARRARRGSSVYLHHLHADSVVRVQRVLGCSRLTAHGRAAKGARAEARRINYRY